MSFLSVTSKNILLVVVEITTAIKCFSQFGPGAMESDLYNIQRYCQDINNLLIEPSNAMLRAEASNLHYNEQQL